MNKIVLKDMSEDGKFYRSKGYWEGSYKTYVCMDCLSVILYEFEDKEEKVQCSHRQTCPICYGIMLAADYLRSTEYLQWSVDKEKKARYDREKVRE